MAIGMWEIAGILILLLFTGISIFAFISSEKYNRQLSSKTLTRGLNGIGGSTVNLQCPSGQTINIYKANYVCTSNSSFENPGCDPYWQTSGQKSTFFNPLNTYDVSADMKNECNGKSSCSWNVPSGSSVNICGQSSANSLNGTACTGQLQLIGTYDCVPT